MTCQTNNYRCLVSLLLSLTSVRLEEQNTQLEKEQKHSTCLGTNHAGLTVAMLGVIKPPEK